MCFLFTRPTQDTVCPFCDSSEYCTEHEMERKHLSRVSLRFEMEQLSEFVEAAECIEYYLDQWTIYTL
jgi:hypothetical protein